MKPEPETVSEREQQLEEVVLSYLLDEDAGRAPDPAEVIARHPHLAAELRAFFADQERLSPLVGPLRQEATPQEPVAAGARIGEYEVRGVIDQGGMGIVLLVYDPDLRRDLALKTLREEFRDHTGMRRRFVEEARVQGQLQHPGIPPIHVLGTLADGRPYFAMKLIQGRTLAELLDERPAPSYELPRFLAIFEQICQTVAYAHSRGILHRDLKPSNVMVGAFGEVQVMDWGLAKARTLGENGQAPETAAAAPDGEDPAPDRTRDGAVLGTPGYMAPEQARGEVGTLDERCDVFGLGAILCVILTGQPPGAKLADAFARLEALRFGADQLEIGQGAKLADAFARLERGRADADLVRLARECLAAERSGRPRDAGELAARVTAYRARVEERLRQAQLERAAAQARAEEQTAKALAERKARRRRDWWMAAVVMAIVAGSGAVWTRLLESRKEVADKAQLALGRAHALLDEGWQANDPGQLKEAHDEAARAIEIARGGTGGLLGLLEHRPAAVLQQAEGLEREVYARLVRAESNRVLLSDLLDVAAPQETRAFRGDGSGPVMVLAQPSVEEQYAAAFRRWGLDLDRSGEEEVVARLSDEPEVVRQGVVAGLDVWMLERRRQKRPEAEWRRLYRMADRVDGDERRRHLRALLVDDVPPPAEGVAGLVAAVPPWPALWELARGEKWRRLLALQKQIDAATAPVQTVLLLAQASTEVGDAAGAERMLRRAAAARPDEVVLLARMGKVLERQGPARLAEAIGCYRATRVVQPRLGVTLARALIQAGEAAEAEAVARDLLRRQPNYPEMHVYLGLALYDQGKLGEAVAAYRQAIDLKPDLAAAYTNLGLALSDQGKLAEAVAALRKANQLLPNDAVIRDNLRRAEALLQRQPARPR